MSDEMLTTKHLWKYWVLVGIYGLLLGAFVWIADKSDPPEELALLAVLILAPAFAYPVAFYMHETAEERRYVKRLSEMWTPAWAAVSLLCVAWSKGGF
jgi:hypothetical protein